MTAPSFASLSFDAVIWVVRGLLIIGRTLRSADTDESSVKEETSKDCGKGNAATEEIE
jgi:hypothetical protein